MPFRCLEYDASYLVYPQEYTIITPKPQPTSALWNLTKPFQRDVWLLIFAAMAIVAGVIQLPRLFDSKEMVPLPGYQMAGMLLNQSA